MSFSRAEKAPDTAGWEGAKLWLPLAILPDLCPPISENSTGKWVGKRGPGVEGKLRGPEGIEEMKAHRVAAPFLILE